MHLRYIGARRSFADFDIEKSTTVYFNIKFTTTCEAVTIGEIDRLSDLLNLNRRPLMALPRCCNAFSAESSPSRQLSRWCQTLHVGPGVHLAKPGADRIITWSAAAVPGVAAVAAMASYEYAHDLVRRMVGRHSCSHGGAYGRWLIDASSIVILDRRAARRPVLVLARWLPGRCIAANVTCGLDHGLIGAAVASMHQ
jgi:hypothetical protein